MSLLFDTPLIDGLCYSEAVISLVEERELLEELRARAHVPEVVVGGRVGE